MKRKVHSAGANLDWTIRLAWTPKVIRPIGPRQLRGLGDDGDALGTLVSLLLFLILVVPAMLIVLPLRYAGVLGWRVEAIAYPWGKREGPTLVSVWIVKGRGSEIDAVVDAIAAALERGETAPQVAGARLASSS